MLFLVVSCLEGMLLLAGVVEVGAGAGYSAGECSHCMPLLVELDRAKTGFWT